MELSHSQIIELAVDRAGAVNVYWNFYVAVATAVLATMASGKNFTSSKSLKVLLSVAFLAFAQSNYGGISNLAEIRNSLLDLIQQDSKICNKLLSSLPSPPQDYDKLICSLRPPPEWKLISFHLSLDAIIVACIWFVPWPKSDSH